MNMKQIVLETLRRIIERKRVANKSPDHATYLELKSELAEQRDQALRELWKEQKIKSGNTLNDKFIQLEE
ncbi:hypothetical protein BXY64_1461 [Marinifilum flexuosum]|uniref:Uncharacterized protein n=2 Tax=Marinifilum flexuosum TaxID=1117708 RepID=A0A419X9M6_9BACT|nr:hypothetical protein BXY64_1461 [Marinifilum flexuosum]